MRAHHAAKTESHRQLAYDTSRWGAYLYDSRLQVSPPLEAQQERIGETLYNHEPSKLEPEKGAPPATNEQVEAWTEEAADQAHAFGTEVFERLYGAPETLDPEQLDPETPWAPAAHAILDELPEWEELRASVQGDPDFSAIAAKGILKAVGDKLPELLEEQEREESEDGEGEGDGDGQGQGPGKGSSKITASDKMRAALRAAVRNATTETAEGKEALAGLAPGMEAAPPAADQPNPERMQLAEKLKNDPTLRKRLELAGRLRRIADQRKKVKNVNAREEVVDIERGADLGRMLPSSLARLRHPKLRLLALRDIVERQAVQYRLEGSEPQGRGPIVVLLDESYSMIGEPNDWARAVGIATVGIGAKEKRAVTVIGFNGGITAVHHLAADGKGYELPVMGRTSGSVGSPRPIGDISKVALAIASRGPSGGTQLAPAFRLALGNLPASIRDKRADLVLVTDGHAEKLPSDVMEDLEALKADEGLKVYGLTVNGGSLSPAVQAICNEAVDIDKTEGDAKQVAVALP